MKKSRKLESESTGFCNIILPNCNMEIGAAWTCFIVLRMFLTSNTHHCPHLPMNVPHARRRKDGESESRHYCICPKNNIYHCQTSPNVCLKNKRWATRVILYLSKEG